MKFRCPYPGCTAGVNLGDKACVKCGQSLAFFAVLALSLKPLWSWCKGKTNTKCPECEAIISLREKLCPKCRKPVTFHRAIGVAAAPHRTAAGNFIRGLSTEAKTGIRWSYVVVSALVFWMLVLRVDKEWTVDWLGYSAIAVVYLSFLYLFFLWIVPRELRAKVARRIRPATKIAALFNFFSFLFLLLLFIAHFWGQASKIALIFGITFAGFFLFSNLLRGLWFELSLDWIDAPRTFSHLGRQGRTAYHDKI